MYCEGTRKQIVYEVLNHSYQVLLFKATFHRISYILLHKHLTYFSPKQKKGC